MGWLFMDSIKKIFEKEPHLIGVKIGNKLYIKNATVTGYLEAEVYDGVDLGYLYQNTRRGRVQKKNISNNNNIKQLRCSSLWQLNTSLQIN